MDIKKWFAQQVGTSITDQEVAEILKVTRKTANKRINGALTADDVLKLSEAWSINPVQALQELGFIRIEDVYDFFEGDGTTLAAATTAQLIKRLAEEEMPLTELVSMGAVAKAKLDTMNELQARRRSKAPREDVPLDLYIDQAAANHAPEEQEGAPGDYEA